VRRYLEGGTLQSERPAEDHRFEQREFWLPDGTPISALVSAPADEWEPILDVFEQVVESVNLP
jgi:hypothetical protein